MAIVGYLSPIKGQLEFIENIYPLIKTNTKLELYLIGSEADYKYTSEILNILKEKKYKNIYLTGSQENMEVWYSSMDIIINYSKSEGMPRTVLEAMSYGVPVVVSDVVGNKDVVQNGINGYSITRTDYEKFSFRLRTLIENFKLRNTLGEKAREIAIEYYDIKISANLIEHLYSSLIKD